MIRNNEVERGSDGLVNLSQILLVLRGMITVLMPERSAAMVFSRSPPIGMTLPRREFHPSSPHRA